MARRVRYPGTTASAAKIIRYWPSSLFQGIYNVSLHKIPSVGAKVGSPTRIASVPTLSSRSGICFSQITSGGTQEIYFLRAIRPNRSDLLIDYRPRSIALEELAAGEAYGEVRPGPFRCRPTWRHGAHDVGLPMNSFCNRYLQVGSDEQPDKRDACRMTRMNRFRGSMERG